MMITTSTVSGAAGRLLLTWLLSIVVLFANAKADETPVKHTDSPIHLKSGGANPIARIGRRLPFPLPVSPRFPSRLTDDKRSLLVPKKSEDNPVNPAGKAPEKLLSNIAIRPLQLLPLSGNLSRLTANAKGSFDYDPIRFTMTASKDSVAVGEEFELTIKAELLDIPSNLMFFFEEQKSFSLKVIMPEGFVQTGGDYFPDISDKLSLEGKTKISYSIRGYLTQPKQQIFTLLRGVPNSSNNLYVKKQQLAIFYKGDILTRKQPVIKSASNPVVRKLPESTNDMNSKVIQTGNCFPVGLTTGNNDTEISLCPNSTATLYVSNCLGGAVTWKRDNGSGSFVTFVPANISNDGGRTAYSMGAGTYKVSCNCDGNQNESNTVTVRWDCSSCNGAIPCGCQEPTWEWVGDPQCDASNNYRRQRKNTNICSYYPVNYTEWHTIETNSCTCRFIDKPALSSPYPSRLCEGNTATLTARSCSIRYNWYKNGNYIGQGSSINISGGGIYAVKCSECPPGHPECQKGDYCESVPTTIIIESIYTPYTQPSVDDQTICLGNSANLSASNCSAYQWYYADGSLGPASGSFSPSPTVTTSYSVACVNSCGAGLKTKVTVRVDDCNPSCNQTASISPNDPCLSGSSVQLSASYSDGKTSSNWQFSSSANGQYNNIPEGDGATLNASQAGFYRIVVRYSGCSDVISSAVEVRASCTTPCTTPSTPTITGNPGTLQLPANGSGVILTVNCLSGNVQWTDSVSLGNPRTVNSAGTYSARCVSGNCSSGTKDVVVTAAPNQCPAVNNNVTIPNQNAQKDHLFSYQLPDNLFTQTYTIAAFDYPDSWLTFNPNTNTFTGTPQATGSWTIKVYAVKNGCPNDIKHEFTLTVSDICALNVSANPTTTTPNSTITLTATGAANAITWSASQGGGLNSTSGSSVTAKPTAEGTYTYTANAEGCTAGTVSVVVQNPTPNCNAVNALTPHISGSTSVSVNAGGQVTLTVTGCGNYETRWYNGSYTAPFSPDRPSVDDSAYRIFSNITESISNIYVRCVDNANNCLGTQTSNSVSIGLNADLCAGIPLPVLSAITVRDGENATIAPSCSTGKAQVKWGDNTTWNNVPFVTPKLSGGINYSYKARCIRTDETCPGQEVTGSVGARANGAPVAPQLENQAGTVGVVMNFTIPEFTDPDGDPLTYSFSPAGIFSGLTANGRTISGAPNNVGQQTITVTASDGRGGTASATFIIFVQTGSNTNGILTIHAPLYNCVTKQFTFQSNQPAGAVEYMAIGITGWTTQTVFTNIDPAADAGAFQLQARLVSSPGVTVSYSWRWQDHCTAPAAPAVTVDNPTICYGQNATLRATNCPGTITWTVPGNPVSISTGPIRILSNLNSSVNNIVVTCTASNGMVSPGTSAGVVVLARPNAPKMLTLNPVICLGQQATLQADTTSCPTGSRFTWSTPASGHTITVRPDSAGARTYSVYCTTPDGCQSENAVISVTVKALPPVPTLVAYMPDSICQGRNALFSASIPGQLPTDALWWNNNTEGPYYQFINQPPRPNPYRITVYTLRNGCQSAVAEKYVKVLPVLAPAITASQLAICQGEPVSLTVSNCAGGTIRWADNASAPAIRQVTPSATTTYRVTCTLNGCVGEDSVTITVKPAPAGVTLTGGGIITCSTPSVELTATPGFARYDFSGPRVVQQIGNKISVDSAGTYIVTVSNSEGCSTQASIAVTSDKTGPTLTGFTNNGAITCLKPTAVLSFSSSNASRFLFEGPGLNQSGTQQQATVSRAGTYTLTATGANGCSTWASTTVTADTTKPVLSFATDRTLLTCTDTTATLTFSGASRFDLKNPANTTIPDVSSPYKITQAGTWVLTGTDTTNGCSQTKSVLINESKVKPTVVINAPDRTLTCTKTTLALSAQATGGSGQYTYRWSTSQQLPTIQVSAAGQYQVTVTDSLNGCSRTALPVTITSDRTLPDTRIDTPDGTTVITCSKNALVLIAKENSAGAYAWSTGATTQAITVDTGGTYSLTVTGANGCPATGTIRISEDKTVPSFSIAAPRTMLTCTNSTVELTVNTTITALLWSNNATTPTITVSNAGVYSVTATAANGCRGVASVTITADKTAPSFTVSNPSASICSGQSAVLTANGCPGRLLWTNTGQTTQSITVGSTGSYEVICTNTATGCSSASTVTVTVKPLPQISIASVTICTGGQATLTLTGCSGAVSWQDNTAISSATRTVTPAATTTYRATCTQNGCSESAEGTVTVSAPPTVSIGGTPSFCPQGSTQLTASGTSGSTFLWSTGSASPVITVATAGLVSVTATKNGCPASASVNVTQQSVPAAGLVASGPVSCAAGTVTLTASGGSQYSFSGPGIVSQSGNTATVNQAGTYTVQVTGNAAGCQSSASVQVTADNTMPQPVITASQTICGGQTVNLTAGGGTTYRWSTGAQTASIAVSPTQTTIYSATVTAANGCSATAQTTVTVNPQATPPTVTTQVGGTGSTNSLTLTAGGCGAGTTTRWTGPDNATATGNTWVYSLAQTSATFAVWCQPATGCSSQTVTIPVSKVNPQAPIIQASSRLVCSGQSVTLTASGCASPAATRWSNGQTGNPLLVNPAQTTTFYAVCEAGQLASEASNSIQITVSNPLSVTGRTVYAENETILLTATASRTAGVSYAWSGPNGFTATGATLQRIGATTVYSGTYSVTASSTTGCAGSASVVVTVTPSSVTSCTGVSVSIVAPASLTAGQPLSLSAVVSPASTSAVYSWRGANSFTATTASAGIPATTTANSGPYSVTVTWSGNGCTATATITVTVLPAGTTSCTGVSASVVAPTSITAGQTLSLSAVVNPGSASALYAWTGPGFSSTATAPTIPNTTTAHSGNYQLIVSLPGGCTTTASTNVTVIVSPVVSATDCNIRIVAKDATGTETDLIPRSTTATTGGSSLTLSVAHLDGLALTGYTYLWSRQSGTSAALPSGSTPVISATAIGEYKVVMTSPEGSTCTAFITLRSKPCRQVAHTYNCGTTPATPVGNVNDPLLTNLAPGDTIRTGDFDVVVMTVSGGSGGWTGTGYTEIPYLKNTRIAVELKGAVVNDCYELVGGTVISAYDPNWGGVRDISSATENVGNQFDQLRKLAIEVIDLTDQVSDSTSRKRLLEVLSQIETIRNGVNGNTFLSDSLKQVTLVKIDNLLACAKPNSVTNAPRGRIATIVANCDVIKEANTLQEFAGSEATIAEAFADFLESFDDPPTKNIIKVTYSEKALDDLYLKADRAGNLIGVGKKSSVVSKTSVLLPKALRILASTPVQVVMATLTTTPAGGDAEIKFLRDQQARNTIQPDKIVPDFSQTKSEVDIEPEPGKVPQTNLDVEDDGKKYLVYICRRNFKCKANFTGVNHCLKYVGISTIDPALVIGSRGRYQLGDIQAREFVKIFEGLKKGEARGVEQALIDLNSPGLETPYRSTRIDNLVNSTARYRDVFSPRLTAGEQKLNTRYPNWRAPYVKQLPREQYEAGGMKFSGNEYSAEPNCCEEQ